MKEEIQLFLKECRLAGLVVEAPGSHWRNRRIYRYFRITDGRNHVVVAKGHWPQYHPYLVAGNAIYDEFATLAEAIDAVEKEINRW